MQRAKWPCPSSNTKFLNQASEPGWKSRQSAWHHLDGSEEDGEDTDDEGSSPPKKRKVASTPNGHSDTSPSSDVIDVDTDDAPSVPVTKPTEIVEPPSEPSTPASPPVFTPTPAPVPSPAVTPLAPSPVINSSSSQVGRSFTRNSYAPREPTKMRTSITDQDSEEGTDLRQEQSSTVVPAPAPQLAQSVPSQEQFASAPALAPPASLVPVSAQEHPANVPAPASAHLVCQEQSSSVAPAPAPLARDAVTSCTSTSGQQREQESAVNSMAQGLPVSYSLMDLLQWHLSTNTSSVSSPPPPPGAGSRFGNEPSLAPPPLAPSSPSSAPSASSSASPTPSLPPLAPGFNWVAAGLAPPSATSEWE